MISYFMNIFGSEDSRKHGREADDPESTDEGNIRMQYSFD
jgi:hypothetical protein